MSKLENLTRKIEEKSPSLTKPKTKRKKIKNKKKN